MTNQFKMPKKRILEKDIEKRLKREIKKLGGVSEKFKSPMKRSVPDQLCMLPTTLIWFVECKAPGKKATTLQLEDHERRRALGFNVDVVDTYEAIDELIIRIKSEIMERMI